MSNYCKDCGHLDPNGGCRYGNEYYCEVTHKYTPTNQSACNSFVEKEDKGYKRAGIPWYIVSIISHILGLDEEEVLYTTYRLRTNCLEETKEGQEFLSEYDSYGPIIADKLAKADIFIIQDIYERYLLPCLKAVKIEDYDTAFSVFKAMYNELKQDMLDNEYINEYIRKRSNI